MFHYSFVHLCCVVPVSVHYILYLVALCVKVLQNGRLVRFSRRTYCGVHSAGASVTNLATLLGVCRAAVSKVMIYTNHGKTSLA